MEIFEVQFAGHPIRYSFRYEGTERYFKPYIEKTSGESYDIMASQEYIDYHRPYYPESKENRYVEYKSLIGLTSQALLPYHCCIFHSVAFVWKGYAWLLTAPSGTGKSTQFRQWKKCYPGETVIISGDMPCMEFKDDGSIWVHPSPWNGKERLKGHISAPLGGIIYLQQSHKNTIRPLSASESVLPLFWQFEVRPTTEDEVKILSLIVKQLIKSIPIWLLSNLGDEESARMTHTILEEYLFDKDNCRGKKDGV